MTARISRSTRTTGTSLALVLVTLFTVLLSTPGAASAFSSVSQEQALTTTAPTGAMQAAPAVIGEQARSGTAAAPPTTAGFPNPIKLAKCVASVTVAFVPTAKAFKAIKELGGVVETAKLLIGAGNAKDFLEIAGGSAAEILGIAGIQDNCF
jgi:hypothetical protein